MAYRRQYTIRKGLLSEINIVPYIDVMLVLLVIFMITAPLMMQGVNVSLPNGKAKALSNKDDMPIVVSVDRLGRYYLNIAPTPSQPISGQKLMVDVSAYLQLAKQRKQLRAIYVKGDKLVNYDKVMHAMLLLQKAGANNVGLITEPIG